MSNTESTQVGSDRLNWQYSDQPSSLHLADLSDPAQVRAAFTPQPLSDQSVISPSGQLMFSNPYEQSAVDATGNFSNWSNGNSTLNSSALASDTDSGLGNDRNSGSTPGSNIFEQGFNAQIQALEQAPADLAQTMVANTKTNQVNQLFLPPTPTNAITA
jgi:hypothetical protein